MSLGDITGYLEMHAEPRSPERSQSFCSCCLNVVTSLQRTSLVAWSPCPPGGIYSFWSVIQLVQTMSIYRQREHQLLILMVWGYCQSPAEPGSCPLWGETCWPLEYIQRHIIVMQTVSTRIVLQFSLLHANIRSSSRFSWPIWNTTDSKLILFLCYTKHVWW